MPSSKKELYTVGLHLPHTSLMPSQGEVFDVAASVQVKNERTGQSCYVSSFEFVEYHSILGDEVRYQSHLRLVGKAQTVFTVQG